ncbi:MAG TPA: creatininase family protein, partial [Candidatus Bathyarchaeia archaeon]
MDHSAGTGAVVINILLVFMLSLGFEVRGVVKVLLSEMSWPEIRDLDKDRVVLIPVGTLEDHGLHLPVDTDVRIVGEVCRLAAEKAPGEVVLLPSVVHGFSPHHMDFPGTITIGWSTFVEYVLDVCRSLARHGFRRILIVNGHGSNQNLVEMVARLTVVEYPGVICAAMFYLTGPKGRAAVDKVRESDYPGGIAHACELETSLYLAIKPELVDMGRAVKEI